MALTPAEIAAIEAGIAADIATGFKASTNDSGSVEMMDYMKRIDALRRLESDVAGSTRINALGGLTISKACPPGTF